MFLSLWPLCSLRFAERKIWKKFLWFCGRGSGVIWTWSRLITSGEKFTYGRGIRGRSGAGRSQHRWGPGVQDRGAGSWKHWPVLALRLLGWFCFSCFSCPCINPPPVTQLAQLEAGRGRGVPVPQGCPWQGGGRKLGCWWKGGRCWVSRTTPCP